MAATRAEYKRLGRSLHQIFGSASESPGNVQTAGEHFQRKGVCNDETKSEQINNVLLY